MLGDPVTKPKEYGDIMGYYSRQTCGQMLRTVFTRLRNQAASSRNKQTAETANVRG
jgi:brefeldin A-resistance guanine nucleotide exchange factor 1